jgi:hypothetical protein
MPDVRWANNLFLLPPAPQLAALARMAGFPSLCRCSAFGLARNAASAGKPLRVFLASVSPFLLETCSPKILQPPLIAALPFTILVCCSCDRMALNWSTLFLGSDLASSFSRAASTAS